MKIKGKTKKILLATIIGSYFATISSAFAFVWPVINLQKISTTVKNINNMISNVTNVTGQIKTTVGKINAIGDVIGSIEKYANEIKSKIEAVKKQIMDVVNAVVSAVETVKQAVEDVTAALEETVEAVKGLVDEAVSTVNNLINEGASKEEVLDVVETAEKEAEAARDKGLNEIDEKGKDVSQTLDEASETLKTMIDAVNEYDGIDDKQKEEFSNRASDIEKRIEELKSGLDEVINNAKENFNEQYSMFVTEAFNEYTQAINDYYSGKISKEELQKAGEKLNKSVSSLDVQLDDGLISQIVSSAQDIANDIETLENDILDAISNNKDYSDKEAFNTILDSGVKYSFSYSLNEELIHAKIVEDVNDSRFLVSCELLCDDRLNEPANNSYPGKTLDPSKFLQYFNDAKENDGKKCVETCNSDESERVKIRKEGVFTHIAKDYSLANLANVTQTKQYATNWITSDKEGYEKLKKGIQSSSDNNRNAESQRKLVDLEIPRAWNFIRRVESLSRAKNMVGYYNSIKSAYLYNVEEGGNDVPGYHANYADVAREALGVVEIKTETTSQGTVTDNIQLFSDVLLYYCNNLKGSEIYKDGHTKEEVEKHLKDCMANFAIGASFGLDVLKGEKDSSYMNDTRKKMWGVRAQMAASDSALKTLIHAIEDNHNSIFVERDSDEEGTFKSLAASTGETNDLRDEYITGALINKFGINQLLEMVDSDAQALQTEVLMSLPEIDYGYFPDLDDEM